MLDSRVVYIEHGMFHPAPGGVSTRSRAVSLEGTWNRCNVRLFQDDQGGSGQRVSWWYGLSGKQFWHTVSTELGFGVHMFDIFLYSHALDWHGSLNSMVVEVSIQPQLLSHQRGWDTWNLRVTTNHSGFEELYQMLVENHFWGRFLHGISTALLLLGWFPPFFVLHIPLADWPFQDIYLIWPRPVTSTLADVPTSPWLRTMTSSTVRRRKGKSEQCSKPPLAD